MYITACCIIIIEQEYLNAYDVTVNSKGDDIVMCLCSVTAPSSTLSLAQLFLILTSSKLLLGKIVFCLTGTDGFIRWYSLVCEWHGLTFSSCHGLMKTPPT